MASHQVWEMVSLLFQKTFMKELISVTSSLALLAKNLSSVVLENWSVVSGKSGRSKGTFTCIILVSGGPEVKSHLV